MELQRFGIKLYLKESNDFDPKDIIPVFHQWIQNTSIPDHLLIDVTDYRHVPYGPAVILVAHEGNYSVDNSARRWGLIYTRKQPLTGTFEERFQAALRAVLYAADLLEKSDRGLTFSTEEWNLFINDRLQVPHTDETVAILTDRLNAFLPSILGQQPIIGRDITQPGGRLAVQIKLSAPQDTDELLRRLSTSADRAA